MVFTEELQFETALISELCEHGWSRDIIKNPTEKDLIKNWSKILFNNNRGIDRLGEYPLTDTEMNQIMEQINTLRTPLHINSFINGRTVSIKRDNPDDQFHLGKEISLKIYDRNEIAGGDSTYQIAEQPKFQTRSPLMNNRRGDLMLLINGMPVFHIELKKNGIPVSQACNQIEKYAHEGVFAGIFSMVQVFVAMTPDETLYFANPGPDGKFNRDFFFHWADFNNMPINAWDEIAKTLLFIPLAHEIIGFYTVADKTDGVLKVMRSYQYNAANRISDKVRETDWSDKNLLGGYIWHTTGSGKTMTSFKSAQLIADTNDADKVIFLMDRIELGTQSLDDYQNFADDPGDVQGTDNTDMLITKLKSENKPDTLIVTSIQKMSRIKEKKDVNIRDIEIIRQKRLVFIVDEAHRSTFGDMLKDIKHTFQHAIFFGFTGTPIFEINCKKLSTTATVFGNELHRYTIADGIRDKNVLGFDPCIARTYDSRDLRLAVALDKAKASTVKEAVNNPKKAKVYYHYMDSSQVKMAGYETDTGDYIKGIEDELPNSQYDRDEHREMVVKDITDNWLTLSRNGKFHALFATNRIREGLIYYRMLKKKAPNLRVTGLFDPTIDNKGGNDYKESGLLEIIDDYNKMFHQNYSLKIAGAFKKDVALRLAHKDPYLYIESQPEQEINILIVVNQMLTGFDSKWINTLYIDKVLEYENIIQAFSRTNRLFGPDKPFGAIRYFRKPFTMQRNVDMAIKEYSGDRPLGLFVEKLEKNLNWLNLIFQEIQDIFVQAGIPDFDKLPSERADKGNFAKKFSDFNEHLEAAKVQGFVWEKSRYEFSHDDGSKTEVEMIFDENTYDTLLQRYKELFSGSGGGTEDVPYEINGNLTEIDTGQIDAEYMDGKFKKYMKALGQEEITPEELQKMLADLHKAFATLTQDEQKYANIFLHDVESGDVVIEEGKTFRDYVSEYQLHAKNLQIHQLAEAIGVDEKFLKKFMSSVVTEDNINEYGRFDDLKETVDKNKAKAYFEEKEKTTIKMFRVNQMVDDLLRRFVISGGADF